MRELFSLLLDLLPASLGFCAVFGIVFALWYFLG